MKLAIILTSDPKNGDEALGRAFNALALAAEAQAKGDEVNVGFAGTGTRWPAGLTKLSHPANGLCNAVRPVITGASCGCAAAREQVSRAGLAVTVKKIPGRPAPVIADLVKTAGIDLLVMGAYGHSKIREFFVGSTTTKMVRTSPASVLMFR